MATWILRRFDMDLASTGFNCMMLTGSHSEGTLIDDATSQDDIKGIGIVSIALGFCTLILDGVTYTFDTRGNCKTEGARQYRLMLCEQRQSMNIEEILNNISTALLAINETLTSINNTLSAYCSEVQETTESLQRQINDLDGKIPDISGLASKDYVDEEIEDVNDRIDSYHPQR